MSQQFQQVLLFTAFFKVSSFIGPLGTKVFKEDTFCALGEKEDEF